MQAFSFPIFFFFFFKLSFGVWTDDLKHKYNFDFESFANLTIISIAANSNLHQLQNVNRNMINGCRCRMADWEQIKKMYRKSRSSLVQYKVFYWTSSLLIIFQFRIDIPTNQRVEIDLSDFHVSSIIRWKFSIEWKRNKTPLCHSNLMFNVQYYVRCCFHCCELYCNFRLVSEEINKKKKNNKQEKWNGMRKETKPFYAHPRHKCLRVRWQPMVVWCVVWRK